VQKKFPLRFPMQRPLARVAILSAFALLVSACGGGGGGGSGGSPAGSTTGPGGSATPPPTGDGLPAAGYAGRAAVPPDAQVEDVSAPRTVVGTGTAASCTGAAFVAAVAKGGVIVFDCGNAPVTITLPETAKIFNDTGPKIVIDGGGKITLSGGGQRRILYMNTCDPAQVWTTSHCQDQDHPQLTLQNLTFVDGAVSGTNDAGISGGGAVFARGGRLKIVNSRFFRNQCDPTGPDVGGGAVRAFDQYNGLPLYVVDSTFGGRSDLGNACSNGGALSSIGVSYTVINSLLTDNRAIGVGANPARSGTPGGGSGGAIYNDGNTFHLAIEGSRIANNTAKEGGGAIFFVSDDRTGTMSISSSVLSANTSAGFETPGLPGIFYLGNGAPQTSGSTLQH
jgi:predicted outer membrane repeat protein